jgi:hypothetical protein
MAKLALSLLLFLLVFPAGSQTGALPDVRG